jgi:iron complex outermembrane receptor protein
VWDGTALLKKPVSTQKGGLSMWNPFVNVRNKKRLPVSGTHTGPFVMALALLYCIAGAAPALAQEPYRLDEVVVTASRIETPLAEAPANVTVITADQIREMGAQTLVDVFQQEPGVFTQNVLGNPKTATIDIRGYGEAAPQNVLFLVNGRRINSIDLSGADLAQIPVDAIERVEVYRGPASVLFGDNAPAGAVNIILKAGEGPPKLSVATTAGSYNFFKPEVMFSGSQDRFSYMTSVSDLDTDGYRHNNALHEKDLLGNFSFDVSDSLKLKLTTGLHTDSYGLPGRLYWSALRQGIVDPKDSTNPNDTASTNDNFFDFVPEIKLRDDVVLSLGASYRDRHTAYYYDYGAGNYYEAKSEIQTYAFTPKMVVSTPIGGMKNVFVIGSDYDRYPTTVSSSGQYFGPSQSTGNIDKRDFAGYADEKIYPLSDLALEAGYRRQKSTFDVDYRDFVNPVLSQTGTSGYERDAYRLSANYSILGKANVFASYGKGFRFPTPDEFIEYGYSPAPGLFVPTRLNTSLKPQTTEELDLGIRSNPWHKVTGAFTYFQSRNRDEMYYNPLTYANENYDKTKRQGIESTLFFNLATGLTLNLTYSYTEALFDGGQFGGNRIPLVPENKASAKLSYAVSDWTFSLSSVYTGERYAISDQPNAQEQLPGYTTFDTSVGYRWNRLTALFTVKNLTDKRYSEYGVYSPSVNDIALYPSPGRQFFLTLRYTLGG